MPKIVTAAKLKKGESASTEVEKGMLALKWMDKRQVNMLSTIHDDSRVTKRRRTRSLPGGLEEIEKPTMVEQYNTHMGGGGGGGQGRPADVLLQFQPSHSQVVETCVFSPP